MKESDVAIKTSGDFLQRHTKEKLILDDWFIVCMRGGDRNESEIIDIGMAVRAFIYDCAHNDPPKIRRKSYQKLLQFEKDNRAFNEELNEAIRQRDLIKSQTEK
jgi:hypothetical protein